MKSKDSIAQSILAHYALYRLTPLLDHLIVGLKKCGILRAVQTFPNLYAPLFMYTGEVMVDDILEAVYIDETQTQNQRTMLFWHSLSVSSKSQMKMVRMHFTVVAFSLP